MESLNTIKLAKYVGMIFCIFILLKIIPKTKLENRDILISSLVLFSLYLIAENVFKSNLNCNVEKLDGNINTESLSNINQFASGLQPVEADEPTQPTQPKVLTPDQKAVDDIKPPKCTTCTTTPERTTDEYGMESYLYKSDLTKYETAATRASDGVMTNETAYTDYNILPVTPENSRLYEYGYSFLPPEKWYPVPPNPPICVTEKKCPVCPVTTIGTPVDMKEWNDSRRITPGDVINIDYAKDKLNSGR
jgi:hypothetical protein